MSSSTDGVGLCPIMMAMMAVIKDSTVDGEVVWKKKKPSLDLKAKKIKKPLVLIVPSGDEDGGYMKTSLPTTNTLSPISGNTGSR